MNSDTPRTDALISAFPKGHASSNWNDLCSFARTLERENQQLREANNALTMSVQQWQDIAGQLREEFARAYTKDGLGLVEENMKLRDGLNLCAEALGQTFSGLSLHEYLFTQFPATQGHIPLRDFCIKQDKALSHPTVQAALKEKE